MRDECYSDGFVCQFAAEPSVYAPQLAQPEYAHNVCFVGNNIRDAETTERYILAASKLGLVIYGNPSSWNNHLCRGKISVRDEAILYSSAKVCLNAHLIEHLSYGCINFRVFNVLSCGGFLISDYSDVLAEELPGAIVFSEGGDDLQKKVAHYLEHPEATIPYRMQGLKTVLEAHTFKIRMRELVNWLEEII